MGLALRPDPRHPAGGHAILAGPGVGAVSAVSVENVFSSQFLGPDGKWGRLRHAFPVAPARGEADALCLGPEIVDHILTDLMIALRDGGGTPLGRVVWPDTIAPRRDVNQGRVSDAWAGGTAGKPTDPPPPPVDPPPPVGPPQPEPPIAPTTPAVGTGPAVGTEPGRGVGRRRRWLVPACFALAAAVALAAWWIRSRPHDERVADATPPSTPAADAPPVHPSPVHPSPAPPTPGDDAQRCSKAFDAKVAAAQDAPDSDRVKLAEEAIGASCGAQAFGAIDGTRWETNEPAAWYQARFYDPNETAPVFREGHPADARAAFDYYARWADRSPRQAEALRKLCATHPDAVGDNAQRKRACAR